MDGKLYRRLDDMRFLCGVVGCDFQDVVRAIEKSATVVYSNNHGEYVVESVRCDGARWPMSNGDVYAIASDVVCDGRNSIVHLSHDGKFFVLSADEFRKKFEMAGEVVVSGLDGHPKKMGVGKMRSVLTSSEPDEDVGNDNLPWPQTMDAAVWAKVFIKTATLYPSLPADEGSMIGWFANAIMVGYDRGRDVADGTSEP